MGAEPFSEPASVGKLMWPWISMSARPSGVFSNGGILLVSLLGDVRVVRGACKGIDGIVIVAL